MTCTGSDHHISAAAMIWAVEAVDETSPCAKHREINTAKQVSSSNADMQQLAGGSDRIFGRRHTPLYGK